MWYRRVRRINNNCESTKRQNTPHYIERTIILFSSYAYTALNYLLAGILTARSSDGCAQCGWMFFLALIMAVMAPLQILDPRRENRGTFAAIGAGILHLVLCAALVYLRSLWWIAVYGSEVLLCGVIILFTRRKRCCK